MASRAEMIAWLRSLPLSKPLKKMDKDFADGLILAEILNLYFPTQLDMVHFTPRNTPLDNWKILNCKTIVKACFVSGMGPCIVFVYCVLVCLPNRCF